EALLTSVVDIVASVLIATIGNGLLGNYVLQRLKDELEGKMKRLQSALDRTVLVHRVQFETEFAATRIIWEKLVATRGTMAALRPTSDTAPEGEGTEQREQRFFERRQLFQRALSELKD